MLNSVLLDIGHVPLFEFLSGTICSPILELRSVQFEDEFLRL